MDRLLSPKCFLVVCFFLLSLWSAFSLASVPRTVGVFEGIKREIAVSDGRLTGRFAPLYQCVFERAPGEFKYVEMPLAQMLYQLKKGSLAVALPLVQTSDRDEYADFGGLLFQTEYVYLLLDDLPPLGNSTGLTYAFVRRFVGDQLIQGDGATMMLVSEWGQAVEMLKRGRADVVILPWVLVDNFMKDYDGEYFVRTAAWVDLSLYVSHAHGDTQLTENLRSAVRHCQHANDEN